MKLIKMITCVIVLCSVAMINGCTKDDQNIPNSQAKGGLAFRAKEGGSSKPVSGVTIKISQDQADLISGTHVATRYTDENGFASFGLLSPGTYFYRADLLVHDIALHSEGVVQVKAGNMLTQDIVFR